LFTGISSFRPAGLGGELKLFELAGIRLVHGWLVDPDSQEHAVLAKTEDYDTSVNAIVDADHLTSGRLVVSEHERSPVDPEESEASGSHQELSPEQLESVAHGRSSTVSPSNAPANLIYQHYSSANGSTRIPLN
jgi:hypothetical protein